MFGVVHFIATTNGRVVVVLTFRILVCCHVRIAYVAGQRAEVLQEIKIRGHIWIQWITTRCGDKKPPGGGVIDKILENYVR
jgi:hypothetical protein